MATSLIQLADQITIVFVPIIITVGVVGNLLNITVLTRSALYQQACSRYFLANAVSNLFYTSVILVYRLLADQFHIDPAKDSTAWCKLIVYVTHVGIFLTPNFIVLASIDRWCASSANPRLRRFSNVKIARSMIVLTAAASVLFFINSAVLVDLQPYDFIACRIRADTTYKQMYVVVQASIVCLMEPFLMAIFGLLTIYNIKRARVRPAVLARDRRTERQLARMLFLQVGVHIILNAPSAVTYLIFVLPNDIKMTPQFFFASMMSVLPFHASYATPFFLYVLSARTYRKELVRLGVRLVRFRGHDRVHPFSLASDRLPMSTLKASTAQRRS